jgi:hypothetical protein
MRGGAPDLLPNNASYTQLQQHQLIPITKLPGELRERFKMSL